ncbi:Ig-like domain-containing protein [Moraxella lacunata]|uniref:Ig-like domain-containing protein n=1 Tax=Moraxella lacunata TaxID=477 RepID=UPI003EDEA09C
MVNGLPWWPLLGVVPFLIRDKDDDPAPLAEARPNTTPDIVLAQVSEDEKVNGVTINVLDNDSSSNINKAGIKLISPQTNQISTEEDGKKVTVKGQGTWTVDDEGNVTFVREEGFTGNPTPINYIVPNNQGEYSVSTAVAVDYGHALTADNASGKAGTPVTQDVLANDNKDGLVTETLQLVNPATGETGLALVVAGEGKWELVLGGDNKPTGEVTFTPEDGFTDNPTPIKYRVTTTTGGDYETTVGVSYDSVSYGNGHTRPDVQVGNLGEPVTIDVTTNDNAVDASSVRLIDPANPGTPETPILVDTVKVKDEGTWTVSDGKVTFTPDTGFAGSPKPINYVVKDTDGNQLLPTPINVTYPSMTTADVKTGSYGKPVDVDVLANDKNIVKDSVKIINPSTGEPTNEVVIKGQGTWSVDDKGIVTFKPEDNYTGNPTPINYIGTDSNGHTTLPTPVTVIYPNPTTPDTKIGTPGKPVTQKVTDNDGNVDPSTVKLVDPNNPNNPPSDKVTIPDEGTWTVTPDGEVTFTPDPNFTGNPTPISYVVEDDNGNVLPPTPVAVTYPSLTNPDTKAGTPNNPVTQKVTDNDGNVDPSTVKLVDPNNPNNPPSDKVTIPDEGTWTVTPDGEVTFTPDPNFTGNPTPISYVVEDDNGNVLPPTPVVVSYPQPVDGDDTPIATNPDTKPGFKGHPVTQNVVDNDNNVDPTTVKLINPITKQPVDEIIVPNEGTWTVGPNPGEITFTPVPELGDKDPSPINYVVKDIDSDDFSEPTPVNVTYPVEAPKPIVSIKATDSVAIEGGEGDDPATDNKLVFEVSQSDTIDEANTIKVKGNLPAGTVSADDIESISYTDGTNTKVTIKDPADIAKFFTDGIEVVIPVNGTTAPVITITAKDDDIPEGTETISVQVVDVSKGSISPNAKDNTATGEIKDEPYDGTPKNPNETTDPNNPVTPSTPEVPSNDSPMVPKDPAKPHDPNNPDENPLVPVDKDNTLGDKPIVAISGPELVNEAVGTVTYTVALDRPATEDIVISYVINHKADGPNDNPTENDDFTTANIGTVQTVTIKKGDTKATINVGIKNDEEHEGNEDYSVSIVHADNKAVVNDKANTVITTINDEGQGTTDGRDPNDPSNYPDPNNPDGPMKDPNNPDEPVTPDDLPKADDDRKTPVVSIKATKPVAVEKATADDFVEFTVARSAIVEGNSFKGDVKITLQIQAGGTEIDAKDVARVEIVDETGKQLADATYADLVAGKVVTMPQDATDTKGHIKVRIYAKDDDVYEISEKVTLAITDVDDTGTTDSRIEPKIDSNNGNATGYIVDDGKDGDKPFDPTKPVDPTDNPAPTGDKPVVIIKGDDEVLESAGSANYTIEIENGKTSDKPIKVKYKVTLPEASDTINPAEQADFGDSVVIDRVVEVEIPAGQTKFEINLPIVDDDIYEGKETYRVELIEAKLDDADVRTTDSNKQSVTTVIDDFEGETDANKDKPAIELDPPAHVSEEGLPGGNKDNDSAKHANNTTVNASTPNNNDYDITNETRTSGKICITNVDTTDTNLLDRLSLDLSNATPIRLSQNGANLTWEKDESVAGKITWYAYETDVEDPALTVTIDNNSRKVATVDGKEVVEFTYDVELHKAIYHEGNSIITADSSAGEGQDNLPVNFTIIAKDGDSNIATNETVVVVIEDDAPIAERVVHNIQVAHDEVTLSGLIGGFKQNVTLKGVENLNDNVFNDLRDNYPARWRILDDDPLYDGIAWGVPFPWENQGYNQAAYEARENSEFSGTNVKELITGLGESFNIGTFTHQNYSIYTASQQIRSGTLTYSFNTAINGKDVTISDIDYNFVHLETQNVGVLDGVAGDLVAFKQSDKTFIIGDTAYRLSVEGFVPVANNVPQGMPENVSYADYLQAQYLYFLQESLKVKTGGTTGYLYDQVAMEMLKETFGTGLITEAENLGLVANGFHDNHPSNPILSKEDVDKALAFLDKAQMVLVHSDENQTNNYNVQARIEPITNPLDLETNVDIQGKIHMGGDLLLDSQGNKKVDVLWTATIDGDNPHIKEITYKDANGRETTQENAQSTEIVTTYGTLVGRKDGDYRFTAVNDIARLIAEGADETFTVEYQYSDSDGDIAKSEVVFNFEGLTKAQMQESRANPYVDGESNDYIVGSTQADIIYGGIGDDVIVGNGGGDTLIGGAGNDVLFYAKDAVLIDGDGANNQGGKATDGKDYVDILSLTHWLELDENNNPLPIDFNDVRNVKNIEEIDMRNDFAQTLEITADTVLNMTDGRNQLFIRGDVDGDGRDTVKLMKGMNTESEETYNDEKTGTTFKVYEGYTDDGSVKLYIQDGINVSGV